MFNLTLIPIIVLIFSIACLIILFFYYFYFFTQIKSTRENSDNREFPVSVCVAARNEHDNLELYLELLLTQDYKEYEVIVINDGSHDGTKELLKEMKARYDHLKIVTLDLDERYQKGKKFALTMGIKAAKYEHLLFTDADCWPNSKNWITKMSFAFGTSDIVLGVSPLVVTKNMLGSIIRYETFHTALQYVSYANRRLSYMGVGRNMAYTKTLFFRNKGFASHQHILSGDDDLFVQENSVGKNVSICLDADSFMYSKGPNSFKQWVNQKKRHFGANTAYQTRFVWLLGCYSFAQLGLYIGIITASFLIPQLWYIPVSIILIKWLVQWVVMYKPTQILDAKTIRWALPYYDVLYTFFLLFFALIRPFTRISKWN